MNAVYSCRPGEKREARGGHTVGTCAFEPGLASPAVSTTQSCRRGDRAAGSGRRRHCHTQRTRDVEDDLVGPLVQVQPRGGAGLDDDFGSRQAGGTEAGHGGVLQDV